MASLIVPSSERIHADVEHLKDWIAKEPHLPTIDDEEWLKTFLYANKFSLEKTKYKLDHYYSFRTKYPEYFTNRDPTGEDLVQLRPYFKHCMGHRPLKDGSQILYIKPVGDPSALNITAYEKRVLMDWDTFLLDPENRLNYHVMIFDCSELKPMHLMKLTTVINVQSEIFNKAYTFRPQKIHILNLESFARGFVEMVVKLSPTKVGERIRFHKTSNTLLEEVDEDVLSSDLGGKGPSLDDLDDIQLKKLEQARDWFKKQENVRSNESLRRKDSNQSNEVHGSFRTLDVD